MAKETYCVYMHRLKSDGRVYIGQSKDPRQRWYGQGNNYKRNGRFYEAIQKYGWDAFSHEILVEGLSKEEANVLEEQYIALYNATDIEHGFNYASRGYTSGIITDETRKKMSLAGIGRKHSEETKAKIGASQRGKIVSEESRARMSASQKGHITSEEHRRKLFEASKPRMRPVRCIETGEEYVGIREAARQNGICHQAIGNCLCGKQKKTHGLHWEYC